MDQQSPSERLRASFVSDSKRLNGLLDGGHMQDARVLARRLAPRVYLAVPGERAGDLYEKLKALAGCARFASSVARPAA